MYQLFAVFRHIAEATQGKLSWEKTVTVLRFLFFALTENWTFSFTASSSKLVVKMRSVFSEVELSPEESARLIGSQVAQLVLMEKISQLKEEVHQQGYSAMTEREPYAGEHRETERQLRTELKETEKFLAEIPNDIHLSEKTYKAILDLAAMEPSEKDDCLWKENHFQVPGVKIPNRRKVQLGLT